MLFITLTKELIFIFKTFEECDSYHKFFLEKSHIHAENNAISQLDEEMKLIWPFPAGSFF